MKRALVAVSTFLAALASAGEAPGPDAAPLPGPAARVERARASVANLERERQPGADNIYGLAHRVLSRKCGGDVTAGPACLAARKVLEHYDEELEITKELTELFASEMGGDPSPERGWVATARDLALDLSDASLAAVKAADDFRVTQDMSRVGPSVTPARKAPAKKAPTKKRAPPREVAKRAPTVSPPSAGPTSPVVRDGACGPAAQRLIKKMWSCGLNAEGFTEESLCSSIDTSVIRYMSNLDTCNEFLTRMKLK